MTKLTPIQELADKHCSETFNHAFKGEYSYEFTVPQLEALRQAIIRDFVKSREPIAYTVRLSNSATDVLNWEIPDENWRVIGCKAESCIPLYYLSEWKTK